MKQSDKYPKLVNKVSLMGWLELSSLAKQIQVDRPSKYSVIHDAIKDTELKGLKMTDIKCILAKVVMQELINRIDGLRTSLERFNQMRMEHLNDLGS